ncbi:MAG: erythromycin esterase family protein [Candidatus Cybelea sp.]
MKLYAIALVFAASVASMLPALAADGSADEAAIRSAYENLQTAIIKKDTAALSSLLTADFSQRQVDGSIESRDAFVKDQLENSPGMKLSSVTYDVTKLTVIGNQAEAETTSSYRGTYTVAGTATRLRGRIRLTDHWTRSGGGTWKLRASTMHEEISYLDGKLVQDDREQLPPTSAAIAELKTRAVLIPTLALDADTNQFAGIGAAIGDARIVGMGEGSHGSSEFFGFKDRLFRYLVEKKGFTIFAMEAAWGAGLNVDRYIKGGRGTAKQAVASLGFWTWDTPEVVNLVRWMRDYNAAPGRHSILSFVGVDMQDPMGAVGYLAAYLRLHDPAEAGASRAALECTAQSVWSSDQKPATNCRAQVAAIGEALDSLHGVPDIAIARRAVSDILQYLDSRGVPIVDVAGMRDKDMAQNVEWIAALHPQAKIAVWAHNGHVGAASPFGYRQMGAYLREAFGENYYVIGQTFGSGTVRSRVSGHGLQAIAVPANPADTIVELFGPLNSAAFLDLRGLKAGSALQTFFSTPRGVAEIGSQMDPQRPEDDRASIAIPASFDGLVYIPTSTASVSGTDSLHMRREFQSNGKWEAYGIGFDDVTASVSANGATLTNADALNSAPIYFLRYFDATPYSGQTVQISGELRRDGLIGMAEPFAEVVAPDNSTLLSSQGKQIGDMADGTWTAFSLTVKVPKGGSRIDAGLLAQGLGSVDLRNLKVAATPASP